MATVMIAIVMGLGVLPAEPVGGFGRTNVESYLRLNAAAPVLLASLKEVVDLANSGHWQNEHRAVEVVNRAKKAIAMAGEDADTEAVGPVGVPGPNRNGEPRIIYRDRIVDEGDGKSVDVLYVERYFFEPSRLTLSVLAEFAVDAAIERGRTLARDNAQAIVTYGVAAVTAGTVFASLVAIIVRAVLISFLRWLLRLGGRE